MTRQSVVVVAALAVAGFLALPAQAAAAPEYTCDRLAGDPGTARVLDNCVASPGAVTHGKFAGESILASRLTGTRVRCRDGGQADVPREVVALNCATIG